MAVREPERDQPAAAAAQERFDPRFGHTGGRMPFQGLYDAIREQGGEHRVRAGVDESDSDYAGDPIHQVFFDDVLPRAVRTAVEEEHRGVTLFTIR